MVLALFLAGAIRSEAVGIVTRQFPAEAIEGQIIEVVLQAEPLVSASAFGFVKFCQRGLSTLAPNRLPITPARSGSFVGGCSSTGVRVR